MLDATSEAIFSVKKSEESAKGINPKAFGGGIVTKALGISAELVAKGRIDLRGKKIKNIHDLAGICQVYRDPRFETFRIIYVKKGKIV
jgi:hypothetical protein